MYTLTAKMIVSVALVAKTLAAPVASRSGIAPEVFYGPGPVIPDSAQTETFKGGKGTEDLSYILNTPGIFLPKQSELNVKLEKSKPKGSKIAPQIFYGPGPVVPEAGNTIAVGDNTNTDHRSAEKGFKDLIGRPMKARPSVHSSPSGTEDLQSQDHVDASESSLADNHVEAKKLVERVEECQDLNSNHNALPIVVPKLFDHWKEQGDKKIRDLAQESMLVVPEVDMDAWREVLEQNRESLQSVEAQT